MKSEPKTKPPGEKIEDKGESKAKQAGEEIEEDGKPFKSSPRKLAYSKAYHKEFFRLKRAGIDEQTAKLKVREAVEKMCPIIRYSRCRSVARVCFPLFGHHHRKATTTIASARSATHSPGRPVKT